jgi:hypothetical protein
VERNPGRATLVACNQLRVPFARLGVAAFSL